MTASTAYFPDIHRFGRVLHGLIALFFVMTGGLFVAGEALAADSIGPFKDRLFAYREVLEASKDGSFRRIAYSSQRDIHARDAVPERRVKRRYVDLRVRRYQTDQTFETQGGAIDMAVVGRLDSQTRFAVIFIHGRGGDKRLGVDDWRFGGNFNRLKNLVHRAGGVYMAPSVPSFDATALDQVAELVLHVSDVMSGRPVVVACASMGGFVCAHLSRRSDTADRLGGLVLLGAAPDGQLPGSIAVRKKVPIYFAHGSDDSVYADRLQGQIFDRIKAADPAYPARLDLFDTGSHGTPIRMIDWRAVLNFML